MLTRLDISKINNISQFISLDGRPLSSARGVAFDIVKLFKTYLRSAASKNEGSKAIADPYLCLQLDCPKGSYDVNIEPGKDDVILEDQELVLSLAESLFRDCYGELSSDPKKSPRKAKNASSHAVGAGSEFSILMARKPVQTPQSLSQPINTRERSVGHGEDMPPLVSPERHVPVFPEVHKMADSQLELRDEDASQMDRNSRFNNPWSITRMNTPRRTPGRHGRTSLSPDMRRGVPDNNRAEFPSRDTLDSPSNISDVASSGNLRESSGSPLRRRQMPPSPSSPPLRKAPLGSNSKRAARERDKERYGNGALDTWFQRTTQISMGHTPLDQPANIDELVPTLSQLAERRFGAEVSPQEHEGDTQEPPVDVLAGASHNVESPSSVEGYNIDADQHSTSMNSGRGYPVLENWAASLKDGFNPDEASGLEWAMDFERRKKEANQRNRARPVIVDQPTEELAPQSSQGPHQKRFLAAKAALAADRPFATEDTSKQEMNINDPRAYLMLHGSAQSSGDQPGDGSSSRRLRTSRLPFEQIPDGFDLHDACLPQPTDLPSLSNLISLGLPHDSYIASGKATSAFDGPNIRDLVPVWTQRLQSIIARQYKRSDSHPSSDHFDIAGAIMSHLQQDSETHPVN